MQPVIVVGKEALLGILLFAQSSRVWVYLGQTGYYHESQVPHLLLKLAWSMCCSLSHQLPCLYLSHAVPPPPPPLFSCPHPHQAIPHELLAPGKVGSEGGGERRH